MRPFVFGITFVFLGAWLVAASAVTQNYDIGDTRGFDPSDAVGGYDFDIWLDDIDLAADGVDMHAQTEHITDKWWGGGYDHDIGTTEVCGFYPSTEDPDWSKRVKTYWIRNNSNYNPSYTGDAMQYHYTDFLVFERQTGHAFFGLIHNYDSYILSYKAILDNVQGNQSRFSFNIDHNFTAFIIIPGVVFNDTSALGFGDYLYDNNFTLYLGVQFGTDTTGKISMWTIIGQLLTLSLPETHPVVRFILWIPFAATITFVLATFISRYIPTVPGG